MIDKIKFFCVKYFWYFIALCILLIFVSIIRQYFYYKEIKDNRRETAGVVNEIKYSSRGSYSLSYTYKVGDKVYKNTTGIEKFYGHNNRKGCVGCKFKVVYSSKDHKKSSIRLGKYEDYKRTVEFIPLD